MKNLPKICLLGATFETKNMGVSALTAGAIQCIVHAYPDAEVFLLDYGKERIYYQFQMPHKTMPLQLLNMRFSKKIYLKNHILVLILLSLLVKWLPSQKIKTRIISSNEYLKYINDSDLIASIAAGDSFSDIYGLERFFYITLPQILILILGKRLILLPQTLGPFQNRFVKFVAARILNKAEQVYSRDANGLNEAMTLPGYKNNPVKYKQNYDIGFIIDPIEPPEMDLGGLRKSRSKYTEIIGLNVSGLLYRGGYSGNNMFGLKVDYPELINDIIKMLIEKRQAAVLLIPHVFGTSDNSENDSSICNKLYEAFRIKHRDHLFVARGSYNQNQIKYIIGLTDFFIGSRMHACIAALSQNIPAISIAYSDKFLGVMQSIGLESLVTDPRSMDKEKILDIIMRRLANKNKYAEHLQRITPGIRKSVLTIFENLQLYETIDRGNQKHINCR